MRWPYFRVEVPDTSMVPTYLPGDRLLVRRRGRLPRAGDVVVWADDSRGDQQQLVVSRVVAVTRQDHVLVAGDNPAHGSARRPDHRLPRHEVLGRVLALLSTVERPRRRTYS